MNKSTSLKQQDIAVNRKAHHDYALEDRFDGGLVLEGWEVKSLRAGRGQLKDSYVILSRGEAWLLNSHISPLDTVSTHIKPEAERSRKLLLHKKELNILAGAVQRKGYTLVPLRLYWHKNRAKIEFALAKGKKLFDKRASEKERDWVREKSRVLKTR